MCQVCPVNEHFSLFVRRSFSEGGRGASAPPTHTLSSHRSTISSQVSREPPPRPAKQEQEAAHALFRGITLPLVSSSSSSAASASSSSSTTTHHAQACRHSGPSPDPKQAELHCRKAESSLRAQRQSRRRSHSIHRMIGRRWGWQLVPTADLHGTPPG